MRDKKPARRGVIILAKDNCPVTSSLVLIFFSNRRCFQVVIRHFAGEGVGWVGGWGVGGGGVAKKSFNILKMCCRCR